MRLTHKQAAHVAAATWNGGNDVIEVDIRQLANGAVRVVPIGDDRRKATTVQRDGAVKVG